MSTRITAAVVAAFAASPVAAQEGAKPPSYQFELVGAWSMSEADTSPDTEINQYLLVGTYHLKPVELADHPWNEAAFLEHSTSVSAFVDYADFEVGSFSADGLLYGVGFRYAEKQTPIAAELRFQLGSLDGDSGVDIDLNELNARIGYWVKPNALVGVDVGLEEVEAEPLLDVEVLRFGAFGKIVHDLGEGRAVNAEARFGVASVDDTFSDEENFEIGFAGDFYFTPQYSAGALVGLSFGDAVSEEGTTLGLRGSAWFSPRVALGAEVSTFLADDDAGADEDTLTVFLNLRF
jgi:hypothetical protein